MHNPAAVMENDTNKLLWVFDIQTDHLISARQPDLIIINKEKKKKKRKKKRKLALQADPRIKLKESEKKDNYLDRARELKKKQTTEHESDNYTNRDWCFWYSHQGIIKGPGGLGNKRKSRDHPNYYII